MSTAPKPNAGLPCSRLDYFATEDRARNAFKVRHGAWVPYLCPHRCGGFHLRRKAREDVPLAEDGRAAGRRTR